MPMKYLDQLIVLITPRQSFSLFLPTIIKGLQYETTVAQLFTAPPNMTGFFAVLILSVYSDKIKARGPIMAGGSLLAIAGYIMLLVAKRSPVRYGGTFLIATGVYPSSAIIMVCIAALLLERVVDADNAWVGLDVQQPRAALRSRDRAWHPDCLCQYVFVCVILYLSLPRCVSPFLSCDT